MERERVKVYKERYDSGEPIAAAVAAAHSNDGVEDGSGGVRGGRGGGWESTNEGPGQEWLEEGRETESEGDVGRGWQRMALALHVHDSCLPAWAVRPLLEFVRWAI